MRRDRNVPSSGSGRSDAEKSQRSTAPCPIRTLAVIAELEHRVQIKGISEC